jgi:hypothetical protein
LRILRLPQRYLSLLEYIQLFHQISNILNHRVIGVNVKNGETVCPAQATFGTREDWHKLAIAGDNLTLRVQIVQNALQKWRAAYTRAHREHLLRRTKWKREVERNAKEGDIVMILDKPRAGFSDSFTLAEVHMTHPSQDGVVRSVTLVYRTPNTNKLAKCERDVTSLALMVTAEERAQGVGYLGDILGEEEQHDEVDEDLTANEDDYQGDNPDYTQEDDDTAWGVNELHVDEGRQDQGGDLERDPEPPRHPFDQLQHWEEQQRQLAQEAGRLARGKDRTQ